MRALCWQVQTNKRECRNRNPSSAAVGISACLSHFMWSILFDSSVMIRRVAVSWECTHSPSLSFSSPQTHSPIKLWVSVCVLTQYLLSPHLLLFCVHLGGGSSSSSSVVLNHWYQQVLNLNLKYKITYWFTQLDVLDLEDFIDNAFTRFLRCTGC